MSRLLADLAPLDVEVSEHSSDPPNPLAGYLKALENPPDCTHLIVLQDDATVCRDFATKVAEAVEHAPDHPLVLFLARLPADAARGALFAMKKGDSVFEMRPRAFVPVVGIAWPIADAVDFREWVPVNAHRLSGRPPRSDDGAVAKWARRTRRRIMVTVPSLVQHEDRIESTIGKTAKWGKDKGRTALFFDG